MEGVIDAPMRKVMSEIGGIDFCVTEFIRVNHHLIPDKVFYRDCPELLTNSRTKNQTPVILQLLGGNAQLMAENACKILIFCA